MLVQKNWCTATSGCGGQGRQGSREDGEVGVSSREERRVSAGQKLLGDQEEQDRDVARLCSREAGTGFF